MARLTFLVCHLSGTGHFVRTLRLARTARARGHDVQVISGGRPLDHVATGGMDIVQLPPLSVATLDFSAMLTGTGAPADQAYLAGRRAALTATLAARPPDVLITELFPLGRRRLAGEFMAAIETVRRQRPAATIVASVRDIPEPKPRRIGEAAERLRQHYDAVLVHGDAAFLPLSATWPLPDDLAPMIHHTGYVGEAETYVGEAEALATAAPSGTVLVATGGGILGRGVLALAAEAAAGSARPWHLLVGGADAAALAQAMRARHSASNLSGEPARPDYPALLSAAACSVSLAGYNTAIELAARSTPALLIPSDEGGEHEQTLRARALAAHPGIEMLTLAEATPDRLGAAAERLAAGPRRAPLALTGDDGTGAIRAIEDLLAR